MIQNEVSKLDQGAKINLFELDLTPVDAGAGKYYFHPSRPNIDRAVQFQGIVYQAWPIMMSGFEARVSGAVQRPTLAVGNTFGALSDAVATYGDIVNARVIRRITYEHFLDDAPTADSLAELPSATYIIERKLRDIPGQIIEFELSTFDLDGILVPRSIVQPSTCPWLYRGEDCLFAGPGTDALDRQPGDVGYVGGPDVCSKSVRACKARHGREGDPLRFGGFPGTLRMVRA